jgi:outer membrane protein OmpA-like peptidoglycan-associated protein
MRCSVFPIVPALLLALASAGCAGHAQSDASASPSPSAAASDVAAPDSATPPVAEATATAASTSIAAAGAQPAVTGGTPIPTPTPTPDPNVLSVANGTILRSYSPPDLDGMNDGNLRDAANGIGSELPASAKPPYVFTFELPAAATITGLTAALRAAPDTGPPASVKFELSNVSADSGYADAGTVTTTAPSPLPVGNVKARWVRVTANQLFDRIGASGTLDPPAAALHVSGIYVEQADPDKNGAFVQTGTKAGYLRARLTQVGSALVATECASNDVKGTYVGDLDGRRWNATNFGNKDDNPDYERAAVNDDGSIVAGVTSGGAQFFTRTTENPAFCIPRLTGTGTHRVLVLDQDPVREWYPTDASPPLAGYAFSAIGAGMLDESMLAGIETLVTRNACKIPFSLAPEQQALLLKWVAAGHKLIVAGGGCNGGSDFTWLTYPFSSAGPGPETTNASLIQIENDALGTNDKNDAAHFVDVGAYVKDANAQLAGSAVVTTNDPHWCGHFFVAKPTNLNGFVQMYANVGTGTIVYDGFNGDENNPIEQKLRQLELALPAGAGLPCTQHVTDSFIFEPNQETTFVAGKGQTIRVPFEILANQGWSGHVTIKTTGDLRATASPSGFDLAGGTLNVTLAVTVLPTTKAGVYTVNAIADNGSGKTAQASVTLTGTAPLVKQFAPAQKRIRIYGIHFDVDSAVIQPRSEPVIAEIAGLLKSSPGLRFQVEGHTDSDGGAAYNLGLSQRRAQAVVDDLVAHHGIARSRLVAKGFGLTKPVASNDTAAGKALNRRVELLRL